jgi:hypothetical protein
MAEETALQRQNARLLPCGAMKPPMLAAYSDCSFVMRGTQPSLYFSPPYRGGAFAKANGVVGGVQKNWPSFF